MDFAKLAINEARLDKFRYAGEQHYHWNRRMLSYYGKDKEHNDPRRMRPKTNRLFVAGEFQKAIMYDHIPVPEYTSRSREDLTIANDMNDSAGYIFDVSNYKKAMQSYYHNLVVFGTGFLEMIWDFDALSGRGMIDWNAIDPRHIFFSPGAVSIDTASYVITAGLTDIDTAYAMFPDKADEISANVTMNDTSSSKIMGFFEKIGSTITSRGNASDMGSDNSGRMVEVIKIYCRVPPVPSLSDLGPVGSPVRLITIVGGKTVAKNDYLPHNHKRIPIVSSQCRYVANRICGMSDLEIAEANQQELDRYDDKRSYWNERSFKAWILASKGIGLKTDAFQTGLDTIWVDSPEYVQGGVKFLSPPQVGRSVAARRDEIIQEINEEVGSMTMPKDIQQLQPTTLRQMVEATEQPIRMKLELAEPALKDAWNMAMSLFGQYYFEPVTVNGSEGERVISPERIAIIKDMDEARFKVNMGITSDVPLSRAAQFARMIETITAIKVARESGVGMSAIRDLLEVSGFMSRKEIIAEMEQAEAEAKAASAAEQEQAALQARQRTPGRNDINTGLDPSRILDESEDPEEIEAALAAMNGGMR